MDREFVLRVLKWKKQGYELAKEVMPDRIQQCLSEVEQEIKDTTKAIVMDGLLGHRDHAGTAEKEDRCNAIKKKAHRVNIES